MEEKILILDFGSQYTQLIARRVRELDTYCEIHPFSKGIDLIDKSVIGIILSGSPCSVRDAGSPDIDLSKVRGKIPILGVCYGAQLLAKQNGGEVRASTTREYGRAKLVSNFSGDLLGSVSENSQVWMSHADTIVSVPENFEIVASTETVKVAAFKVKNEQTFGIQFHPEVTHSLEGKTVVKNFVVNICGSKQSWTANAFIHDTIEALKTKLGNDKVVMALSGGVDSTVAAMLVHRAIGKNLYCIFVDNGVLRLNEFETVLENYKHMGLNIKGVDSRDKFYSALAGKTDPEDKRKAIGKTFIDVFDEESKILTEIKWLGQGTIYPDVIESVSVNGPSVMIKSHHNVGGLPEKMHLKIVEPLRSLFKDEVRDVGKELGIDPNILQRHPFPGPGLAIRILGEITPEKVDILQKVDDIFISLLKEHGLYDKVWQAGSILLPVQTVGVMGDERTYENAVALRAVTSVDGMTADWAHLPYEFLAKVSNDIINKVKGVNRVVYDISSKPPATIEWE